MNRGGPVGILVFAFVVGGSLLGCGQWTNITSNFTAPQRSGFLKEEFLTYQKIAVLPFEGDAGGETSDHFTKSFRERFLNIEIVDQHRFLQTFKKEDLFPHQLNQATRMRIDRMFGVQAAISGSVFYPNFTTWQLRIRIVDIETGETMGVSFVEMRNMGAEGMVRACSLAVQQLTPKW